MKDSAQESEQKRLESLRKRKQQYQMQKNVLKNAFSNLDQNQQQTKKIIFNDDDEPVTNNNETENANTNKNKKINLFGDNEEDEEGEDDAQFNFEVKEHFEGEKGKKLWELQNKTKKDKRFEMDARFLDDDNDNEGNDGDDKEEKEAVGNDEEMSLQKEKELERKIMEKVLGKSVPAAPASVSEKKDSKRSVPKNMRYDPSNPEHEMYEIKETKEKKPKKEKKKKVDEEVLPEVSKETFYEVKTDFKQSLQEKESFSLLNMFGRANTDDQQEDKESNKRKSEDNEDEERPEALKKVKKDGPNPFKYDSSEDEHEEDKETDHQKKDETTNQENHNTVIFPKKSTARPWHEPFFFTKDDYRFQEGRDFLQKAKSRSQEEFLQLRSELKRIVKAKVKNISKKHKMFKRKLGGSKKPKNNKFNSNNKKKKQNQTITNGKN